MNLRSFAFVLLVVALLTTVAVGLFIATAGDTPSSTGEVSQSPFIYVTFLLLIFLAGFLLTKVLSHENSTFSYFTFVNVSLAGVLMSGLAHEFVHVLLINHPVQLRVHFGDAKAVFSTCCLSPGESPYEGVAYVIQFLVLVVWIALNRHTFYNGRFRELWKNVSGQASAGANERKPNSPALNVSKNAARANDMNEDDLEKEWHTHKSEMEDHLSGKTRPQKKETALEDDVNTINRLKV
jgi:hypothetical protein